MKKLPDNLWTSPVIKARLNMEAAFECRHGISDKKHYWCMVPFADSKAGFQVLKNYEDNLTNCDPHELQQAFAKEVQGELQRHASEGGLWLIGYTHPPDTYGVITDTENCWNRMIAIWFDEDGDPQYTVESDRPFVQQAGFGAKYFVGLASNAHGQWKELYGAAELKRDMMLKESQTKKAALEALR